nr:hypothetical protein [Morchella crassipes]
MTIIRATSFWQRTACIPYNSLLPSKASPSRSPPTTQGPLPLSPGPPLFITCDPGSHVWITLLMQTWDESPKFCKRRARVWGSPLFSFLYFFPPPGGGGSGGRQGQKI